MIEVLSVIVSAVLALGLVAILGVLVVIPLFRDKSK